MKETSVNLRLHAAATAASLSIVLWLLASRSWFPGGRGPWLLLPGVIHLLLAVFWPRYAVQSFRGGMAFGTVLGNAVSRVLLSLLYVLVILPLGLTFRLMGRDLLARRPRPGQTTNWIKAPEFTPLDRLF